MSLSKKPEPAAAGAAAAKNDKDEPKEKEKEKEKSPEELAVEAGAADPEREADDGDQVLKDALAEREKEGTISPEGATELSNLRNKGVRFGKREAGKEKESNKK